MKYFLILTLWKRIFLDTSSILLKLLEVISKASYYNQIFESWLQDLPADYFKYIIHQLVRLIDEECKKLI